MDCYDADAEIRLRHLCEVANEMTDDELPVLQALLDIRKRDGQVNVAEVVESLGEAGSSVRYQYWTASGVSVDNLSPDPGNDPFNPLANLPDGTCSAAELLWSRAQPSERAANQDLRDVCSALGVNIARMNF